MLRRLTDPGYGLGTLARGQGGIQQQSNCTLLFRHSGPLINSSDSVGKDIDVDMTETVIDEDITEAGGGNTEAGEAAESSDIRSSAGTAKSGTHSTGMLAGG